MGLQGTIKFTGSDVRYTRYLVLLVLVLLFAACVPKVKPPPLPPVTAPQALVKILPHEYPDFVDDMPYGTLEIAIEKSLDYLGRVDPSRRFRFGPDTFTVAHLADSMEAFLELINQTASADEIRRVIETSFWVYKSVGSGAGGRVLFTGYYEPLLQGSLHPSPDYPHAIYAKPDDWVSVSLGQFNSKYAGERIVGRCVNQTLLPYYSREDIDSKGILQDKGHELLWVSDRIEVFFLHIQGSGQVVLEDGTSIRVNYDCPNGRPYRSIGKLLIDEGSVPREEMSMERIYAFLRNNPEDIDRVLNYNESYIFFRIADEGPMGALGVPVTPGRSIATDLGLFPRSALAFIQSEQPVVDEDDIIESWEPLGRFVLNQDTGGAIRGPGRVDLFWGSGLYAETAAGYMKHEGTLYFLVLKRDL